MCSSTSVLRVPKTITDVHSSGLKTNKKQNRKTKHLKSYLINPPVLRVHLTIYYKERVLFIAVLCIHVYYTHTYSQIDTSKRRPPFLIMSDAYCLIRNATGLLEYGGKKFLIDPMLAQKDAYPGFENSVNSHLRNPLVELPMPVEEILKGVDAVILTHTHPDHWDEAAVQAVPKSLPFFTQNASDAALLQSQGFTNVQIMGDDSTDLGSSITMHRTACQHGSDQLYATPGVAEMLGQVAGLVFQRPGGKTVYFVADTIWFKGVEEALHKYKPDYVVLNIGNATLDVFGPIIMGEDDVTRTLAIVPDAVLIGQHMEAVNHCVLTRQQLREFVEAKGVASKVFIPADGEYVPISA